MTGGYKNRKEWNLKVLTEQKENYQESLPQIVERMLAVCKNDPQFKLKDKILEIDNLIDELEMRVEKKDSVLLQSEEAKNAISQRISTIDESNYELRMRLLESLGSDLWR